MGVSIRGCTRGHRPPTRTVAPRVHEGPQAEWRQDAKLTPHAQRWDAGAQVEESSPIMPMLLAGLAVLLVVGGWLALKWQAWKLKRAASKAAKKGIKAEKDAEKLLKKLGYTLLQRQPPGSYYALINGEPQQVSLNADLLVEHKGKSFIAEVKTGKAASFEHAETRRQLLEYQMAFGVQGMLLVDMETKTVKTVKFPGPKPPAQAVAAKKMAGRVVAIAVVTGLAIFLLTRGSSDHAAAGSQPADDHVLEHEPVLDDREPVEEDPLDYDEPDEEPADRLGHNPNKLPKK
jgi:hypothetical protein